MKVADAGFKTWVWLTLLWVLPAASAYGQAANQEQQVAVFRQAVQQSMAGLKKYEWIETTTVSLKGEVKSQKQNRCYYGADGTIQKIPVGESPAPQQQASGGVRGRLKEKVVAKKTGEMTDYMKAAVELLQRYVPPNPDLIKYSKDTGKVSFQSLGSNQVVRVSFRDFVKTGDSLGATLKLQANSVVDINVSSYLDSPNDKVSLAVGFAQLPDGTSYQKQIVLDAPAKNMKVVVSNTGHRLR